MTAKIWDSLTGNIIHTFESSVLFSANFSPLGKEIVTAGDDKKARIWDIESGSILHVFRGHSKDLTSVI